MEQSAKRAIFLGVAIFISIIIISIIVIAISNANEAGEIANEYTGKGINRDASAQSILGRDRITGKEAIYLLQAAKMEKNYSICIYNKSDMPDGYTNIDINNDEKWLEEYEKNILKYFNEKENYNLNVNYGTNPVKITLIYQ